MTLLKDWTSSTSTLPKDIMDIEFMDEEHLSRANSVLASCDKTKGEDIMRGINVTLEYVCQWTPTNLRLPSHGEEFYLCLPTDFSEATYFKQREEQEKTKDNGYCSLAVDKLRLASLDRYLASIPPLVKSAQTLLADGEIPNHRLVTSTNSGRVINVFQAEIAHCTPSQCDTLVTDDATTCHIIALWSRYVSGEQHETSGPMATMTHVDGPGYQTCLRNAVQEHINHHTSAPQGKRKRHVNGTIELSIHIVGGFNDMEDSSIKITDDILRALAEISNEFDHRCFSGPTPRIQMTLETCAVSSANDRGPGCPLARGLGMDVATGSIFLAQVADGSAREGMNGSSFSSGATSKGVNVMAVDGDLQLLDSNTQSSSCPSADGPEATLRSVRLWASAFHCDDDGSQDPPKQLHVIQRPSSDYLCISPFFFGTHPASVGLLRVCDKELVQITSTSPSVEKPNFASKVRNSLTFMNATNSSRVFTNVNGALQPMKFQRVGLNKWARVQ